MKNGNIFVYITIIHIFCSHTECSGGNTVFYQHQTFIINKQNKRYSFYGNPVLPGAARDQILKLSSKINIQ